MQRAGGEPRPSALAWPDRPRSTLGRLARAALRRAAAAVAAALGAAAEAGRRAAEAELAAERARLRAVLDRVPVGVVLVEAPSGRVTLANERAAAILGRPAASLEGARALMGVEAYRADGVRVRPREVPPAATLRTGGPAALEALYRRPDTKFAWLRAESAPVRDAAGRLAGAVVALADVDAERRTAAALRESEARFREMADNAPVMVWVTDAAGACLFLNRPWHAFTGQAPEAGLRRGWLGAVHPDDRPRAELAARDARAARAPFRVDHRLRRADGAYRWAIVAAAPRFGPQGAFLGHVGSVVDIHERQEAEAALAAGEARFRAVAEAVPGMIFALDAAGRCTFLNARLHQVTGLPPEAAAGWGWLAAVHPEDAPRAREGIGLAVRAGEAFEVRLRFKDGAAAGGGSGGWRWHLARAEPQGAAADPAGQRWVGTAFDIDDLVRAEASLQESEARLRRAVEDAPFPVIVHAEDGEVVHLSRAWLEITGYRREELPTVADWADRAYGGRPAPSRADIDRLYGIERAVDEGESEVRTAAGATRVWDFRSAPLGHDGRGRRLVVTMAADLTERKEAERRIERLALYDPLTELPNRTLLADRLRQATAAARRLRGRAAVLMLDLDNFKDVNDTFGHPTGDGMLRAVAARLHAVIRTADTVARLGGDEFAIVQTGVRDAGDVTALADRVLGALAAPVEVDGRLLHAAASLGGAVFPDDAADPDGLLRGADLALYQAKLAGRGTFRLFSPVLEAKAQARKRLEIDLRAALEGEGGLELHFQPQLDLKTGRFATVEALLRWRHAGRGAVPPLEFIPVAETSGLIRPLGLWVLRAACKQARAWRDRGLDLVVAVNLSPAQIRQGDVLPALDECLAHHGLEGRALELEITEGVLVDADETGALELVRALRERGVGLAIDDFGVGYSSLGRLRALPVPTVKIDRSFVDGLGRDPDDEALVEGMVALARKLGKRVVAEGIETRLQLDRVRELGCDGAQGFYLARPAPGEALPGLLERAARSVAG